MNKSIRVGVRLGEFDLTQEVDCQGNICADPVLVLGVEQKIAHEGYNERNPNRANDIGLIRLDSEVTFTDYVRPICLPSSVNSPRATTIEKLVSAGWGRTQTSKLSYHFILHFVLLAFSCSSSSSSAFPCFLVLLFICMSQSPITFVHLFSDC